MFFLVANLLRLLLIGTKVTTEHQKWPKTCPNNTKILSEALEVVLRSGQSLLVAIKSKLSICLEKPLYIFSSLIKAPMVFLSNMAMLIHRTLKSIANCQVNYFEKMPF